jgi:hypothetical protein
MDELREKIERLLAMEELPDIHEWINLQHHHLAEVGEKHPFIKKMWKTRPDDGYRRMDYELRKWEEEVMHQWNILHGIESEEPKKPDTILARVTESEYERRRQILEKGLAENRRNLGQPEQGGEALPIEVPRKRPDDPFLPRDMTRVSPFVPMSKMDKGLSQCGVGSGEVLELMDGNADIDHTLRIRKIMDRIPKVKIERESLQCKLVADTPALSMADEDVLLVLTKLYRKAEEIRDENEKHVHKRYRLPVEIRFTIYELLKEMGLSDVRQNYVRVIRSILAMAGAEIAVVTTEISEDGTKRTLNFGHLIDHVKVVEKIATAGGYKRVVFGVRLSPEFVDLFHEGRHTYIDYEFRRKLKDQETAKALHRFLEGQSYDADGNLRIQPYLITLAEVIGLKVDDRYEAERRMERALKKLKKEDYLLDFKIAVVNGKKKVSIRRKK